MVRNTTQDSPDLAKPKKKRSAGRNLPVAIGVGVALAFLVVVALFLGPAVWYPVVAVAIAGAMWEVLTRLREHSVVLPRRAMIVYGQLIIWLSWPFGVEGVVIGLALSTLAVMFGRLFHYGPATAPKNFLRDSSIGLFVLLWVPFLASFVTMMSLMDTHDGQVPGSFYILSFMACVVASDTGGYIAGVLFGKHPMAPAVSPKKTWEGLAGSFIGGIVVSILCVVFLLQQPWWVGAILGALLVICATMGDLVESQFKRELGIKDMSQVLPGHGGLMDRLDGMLPAAAMSWVVFTIAL